MITLSLWFGSQRNNYHLHLRRTQSIELASKNMKYFFSIHTCVIQIKHDNFLWEKTKSYAMINLIKISSTSLLPAVCGDKKNKKNDRK